jgi:hypothetical protein
MIAASSNSMVTIDPPEQRTCERCGREEVWSDTKQTWVVAESDTDDPPTGEPHCLHEWDISGNYNPVRTDS